VPSSVGPSWRDRLRPTLLVYVATVIAVVSSVGAPLVPSIADGYGVSLGAAQWSLTVALLVGALSAPVIGRLGDGPRRKGVLLAVLGTMTAGCLLAAIPGPFAFLLVGRAAQGVGLSVLPLTMGLARDYVPPHALPRLLATLSVTASAGLGLGYPISGLIAEQLSFHASFWFGVVFGVVAILGTLALVPRGGAGESEPFDRIGSLTLLVGIASFTLALSQGEAWGWTSPVVLTLFVVSPVALLACARHELRCAHPLVDLRSFRHRTVLTANVASLLLGLAMYMLLAMVARFVQTPTATGYGLGESVTVTGLALLPLSVMALVSGRVTPHLARLVGATWVLPVGALTIGIAFTLFAVRRDALWEILVVMAITGIGLGWSAGVLPRMIVNSVSMSETSRALAMHQLLRAIGTSVGSAASATILTAFTHAPSRLPVDRGYTVASLVGIAATVLMAVLALWLRRAPTPAPDDTSPQVRLAGGSA